MNFDRMPELHWYYGYPAVVGLMAVIGLILGSLFRRQGWLRALGAAGASACMISSARRVVDSGSASGGSDERVPGQGKNGSAARGASKLGPGADVRLRRVASTRGAVRLCRGTGLVVRPSSPHAAPGAPDADTAPSDRTGTARGTPARRHASEGNQRFAASRWRSRARSRLASLGGLPRCSAVAGKDICLPDAPDAAARGLRSWLHLWRQALGAVTRPVCVPGSPWPSGTTRRPAYLSSP
jgi:hypothetical protein